MVVYVHGGGWRAGDKSNQIAGKVNLFTGAGYVFVSINYRLSPTDADAARSRSGSSSPTTRTTSARRSAGSSRNIAELRRRPDAAAR